MAGVVWDDPRRTDPWVGTHLHDFKAKTLHLKHKIGKFENLVNPNHRHDEPHEKATDRKRSAIAESHRFKSFAPVREGNKVKWYVDALDYLWAVSVALEKARETIYIADWWLSPELFLRRPPFFNQEWRLDQILKRRAEAGVHIYVIVYKEVSAQFSDLRPKVFEINFDSGRTSPDVQFRAYETCLAEPLSRRFAWSWQNSCPATPGP